MSSTKERDIARQLAEREGLDPPAGLLERIKSEIPATIQLGAAAPGPEKETRGMPPARQRWLLAASLVAMVGAGLFELRVREQSAAFEGEAHLSLPQMQRPRSAAEPGPSGPLGAVASGSAEPELRRDATASAPQIPPPPKPIPREVPAGVAGGMVGRVEGGVSGGVVGGVPSPAPPAAQAAQSVPAPVPLEAELTVLAESPLRDERQAAPKGESQPEYHDFDSFEEMDVTTEPASPGTPTGAPAPVPERTADGIPDRINVGGNESGQPGAYVGPGSRAAAAEDAAAKAKDRPGPPLAAAAPRSLAARSLAAPFQDAAAGRRLTYEPGADSGSCEHARRELAAGRLPEPGSVRVGDFLGFLDSAGAGRGRLEKTALPPAPVKAQLLEAEGAPNPFGDARSRLLLFRLRGGEAVPAGARMEVELNPAVVARYREIGAGPGLSALYEVELRDDAASGRIATPIATVKVHGLPALREEERELALSGLAASWETASPGFRLAVLAAELAESLKGYPWAPRDLGAIARQIREAARGVPGNPRAAELVDLAEAAARLRGNGGP